jgi:hypothetical protein
LGLCNYYRRFICDYAQISQPTAKLIRKDNSFVWSSDCESAFSRLKTILSQCPIPRKPDVSRPFTVYTDASGYALGAILAQYDDNNKEMFVIMRHTSLKMLKSIMASLKKNV